MKAPKTPSRKSLLRRVSSGASNKVYSSYDEALSIANKTGGMVAIVDPKSKGPLYNKTKGFIVIGVQLGKGGAGK